MRKSAACGICAFLMLSNTARAQEKADSVLVYVTGADDAAPVVRALTKQFNAAKPFAVAAKKDDSKVAVMVSCMARKPTEPFVCMYVSQYNGAAFSTFLGGGLFFNMEAEAVARDFFISVGEDILERIDKTSTTNLRQALEACLYLTDSKCNVPAPLQKEFGSNPLSLGQYVFKKNQ